MRQSKERFTKLKQSVDKLRSERDRASGMLHKAIEDLREGFDVETSADAEKLLASMEEDYEQAGEELESAFKSFEKKWKEHID